jgi:hypothetical protein
VLELEGLKVNTKQENKRFIKKDLGKFEQLNPLISFSI